MSVPSEIRTITVTYTVDSVRGHLIETTPLAGPQSWAVGSVRAHAVGDDGSFHEWQLRDGDPQPVIGSRFVRSVVVEDA